MSEINKVLEIAGNEIGYLEKANQLDLDSKTANAGRNNFTKYWRDLKYNGYQGQPWCLCFVVWCFVKAFGESKAKNMLYMNNGYSFYTPTSAQYFKTAKSWFIMPQVGDIVFFKNSKRICHVGIVCQITADKIYTIEGNTNGGNTLEANGGAVAKKSYPLKYNRIAGFGRPKYNNTKIIPIIPNSKPILKKGSKGPQVVYLQQCLNFLGAKLVEDGDFGKNTDAALRAFQTKYKLLSDGEYGPKSKAMLERVIISENK